MPLGGVEPNIPESERRQIHVLDHADIEMCRNRGVDPIVQNPALNINILSVWGSDRFDTMEGIHDTSSVLVGVEPRRDKEVGRRE